MKSTIIKTIVLSASILITTNVHSQGIGQVIESYIDNAIANMESENINTSNMYTECIVAGNGETGVCNSKLAIIVDDKVSIRSNFSQLCSREYDLETNEFMGIKCDLRGRLII